MKKKIICDIDGVLCYRTEHKNFGNAIPIQENILKLNSYYDNGYHIIIYTARRYKDKKITEEWLKNNGIKYNKILFNKPEADIYVDDRAVRNLGYRGSNVERKKLCICVSGGMDSAIAWKYAQIEKGYKEEDIICLNINLGQPYVKKEQEALKNLGIPFIKLDINICNKDFGINPTVENYIIPGRNMLFATLGSMLAERVRILGTKYENHYQMFDKNDAFFEYSSIALSQAIGGDTIIETPFINMSKTDMIKWCKDNGIGEEYLGKSISCYDPIEKRCGKCGLCFKRHIAMKQNGIEEIFSFPPEESQIGIDFIKKYQRALENKDYNHYSFERIKETILCFKDSNSTVGRMCKDIWNKFFR